MTAQARKTPGDFRADIARQRAVIYELAAEVGVWPGRLGQMLNERVPMPQSVAHALERALARRATDQSRRDERGEACEE